jgi:uncharacterized protein DUF6941
MKVQFALCAQAVTVDRTSNRLSIINVIDILPVSHFPHFIPGMTFVCLIESEDGDRDVKGFFQISSNGVLVGAAEVPINFTDNRLARIVLNFQGISVPKPGPLKFCMTLPNGSAAETSFQVISVAPKEAIQVVPPTLQS